MCQDYWRRVGEGGVETNNKFYRSSTACLAFLLQEMQIVQFSLSLDPIYKIADLFTTGSSSQHFQMRPSGWRSPWWRLSLWGAVRKICEKWSRLILKHRPLSGFWPISGEMNPRSVGFWMWGYWGKWIMKAGMSHQTGCFQVKWRKETWGGNHLR